MSTRSTLTFSRIFKSLWNNFSSNIFISANKFISMFRTFCQKCLCIWHFIGDLYLLRFFFEIKTLKNCVLEFFTCSVIKKRLIGYVRLTFDFWMILRWNPSSVLEWFTSDETCDFRREAYNAVVWMIVFHRLHWLVFIVCKIPKFFSHFFFNKVLTDILVSRAYQKLMWKQRKQIFKEYVIKDYNCF